MANEYIDIGVPFLRSLNIEPFTINTNNLKYISPAFHARLKKSALHPGDIVIVRTGKPGACALVPEWLPEANCSDLVIVRPRQLVDKHFLVYYINTIARPHVSAHLVGAVQQHFNVASARKISVLLPPFPEQRAIASILGALDDKIELNRRMNATLEATARAIFQSWFVDFDPVRAHAEGRETGLPAEIAALFPNGFVESELREIPEGWKVLSLDSVARFLNGLALQKYPPTDDRILPVIKISQLRAEHTLGADLATAAVPPEYVVGDGDVLFSWSGSLECAIWAGGAGALNQHLFKVTSDTYPKWFYYFWIHEHLNEFRKIAAGKATTMGHIQRHHLTDAKVVIPSQSVLGAADLSIAPLLERSWRCKVENNALANVRDALLPKLVSGELRVTDIEEDAVPVV